MPRRIKISSFKQDKTLLVTTLSLVVLGILAVADASAPQAMAYFDDSLYFVKQQVMWAIIGLIAMFIVSRFDYHIWQKFAVPIFIVSLVSLVVVLIPGIGTHALGARRWINLGPVGYQPSELVKLALVIYFASLAQAKKDLKTFVIILALLAGLIMLQPDLGTTIIVTGIGFTMMYLAGFPILSLLGVLVAGAIGAFTLIMTSSYRRERLMTFLGMGIDHQDTGYHISQVLIALGSGGIFGVGLGQGRQKYLFLPEAATDSVFAVIAEEIGFVGSIFFVGLFIFFLLRGLKVVRNAPDKFGQLLGSGIVVWIGIQFFLNLSSMLALTPLTGVPLPFFSYGGSSLTMILVGVGILLSISKYAKTD
jgi:cell division protein FtsW